MPFFKKERKQSQSSIFVDNFGKMSFLSDWYTEDSFILSVFGKEYAVSFHAICNETEAVVNEKQILSCGELLHSTEKYQNIIERLLRRLLSNYEETVITEVLTIEDIYFSPSGSCGVAASLTLGDDELEEIGIGPENEFGMVLSPEPYIFYSGEEFFGYFLFQ